MFISAFFIHIFFFKITIQFFWPFEIIRNMSKLRKFASNFVVGKSWDKLIENIIYPRLTNHLRSESFFLNELNQTYLMEKLDDLKANANNTEESDADDLSTFNNIEENSNESNGAFKWPNEAILLLVEVYRTRADDFCSGKVSQKRTWQAVSDSLLRKGYSVTGPPVTYKSIKDHNNKSGNGPRTWTYFNIMDSVIGSKPYMQPIATISSTGEQNFSANVSSETLSSEPPKKKLRQLPTVDKVVLAMERHKTTDEQNRERRHREKMDQKEEALNLLSRLIKVLEKLLILLYFIILYCDTKDY
ncbi:trihelix transcription factor ASIL1-like, partial [Aphis craccivora]